MVNTMISIPGYVHLYRSLLRFYDMPENEVREMLYLLNTANLDCYEYYHPDRSVIQSGPVAFCGWLETKDCRPYRTEVQLYKSLLFLKRSIDRDLIVSAQREALQTLRCIISNLEYRFYKAYGMEIEDKRTVYGECTYRLVPREDEPSVCLMHYLFQLPDWNKQNIIRRFLSKKKPQSLPLPRNGPSGKKPQSCTMKRTDRNIWKCRSGIPDIIMISTAWLQHRSKKLLFPGWIS